MIHSQRVKYLNVTPPAAIVDDASFTTAEVDSVGFDHAAYVVSLGALDIAITAAAVTHSDTAGSGHANITGLVMGTSNQITGVVSVLPLATDDDEIFLFEIDLRGKNRYLDLTLTMGDGTVGGFAHVLCILSRAEEGPFTAADKGANQVLRA